MQKPVFHINLPYSEQNSALKTHQNTKDFQQAITNITQHLLNEKPHEHCQKVLVTSRLPSEGKTTLSLHLAQHLAHFTPTLLIETDLRVPAISRRYQHPCRLKGITNLVAHPEQFEQNTFFDEEHQLTILPAGMKITSEKTPLSADVIKPLLAQIEKQFQFIIIDTPPVDIVADIAEFEGLVDGAIWVQKINTPHHTDQASNKANQKDNENLPLADYNIPLLGIIQNQTQGSN